MPDDFDSTLGLLKEVLESKDVVLITGGISVGDYDFVGKALQELNVSQLFYKVKQKPGKPIYFGKKKQTYVFALPVRLISSMSLKTSALRVSTLVLMLPVLDNVPATLEVFKMFLRRL